MPNSNAQLFTHANLMFTNECLGELAYEGTTSAIVMAGIFMSFLLEYIGQRYVQARRESKKAAGVNCSSHDPMETLGVMVLEGGIIFHSLRKFSPFLVSTEIFETNLHSDWRDRSRGRRLCLWRSFRRHRVPPDV